MSGAISVADLWRKYDVKPARFYYWKDQLMNKDIRRRIKIIDSLPTEKSAMKIIYLKVTEINEKWSLRTLKGYYKCVDEIRKMFHERYPS